MLDDFELGRPPHNTEARFRELSDIVGTLKTMPNYLADQGYEPLSAQEESLRILRLPAADQLLAKMRAFYIANGNKWETTT